LPIERGSSPNLYIVLCYLFYFTPTPNGSVSTYSKSKKKRFSFLIYKFRVVKPTPLSARGFLIGRDVIVNFVKFRLGTHKTSSAPVRPERKLNGIEKKEKIGVRAIQGQVLQLILSSGPACLISLHRTFLICAISLKYGS